MSTRITLYCDDRPPGKEGEHLTNIHVYKEMHDECIHCAISCSGCYSFVNFVLPDHLVDSFVQLLTETAGRKEEAFPNQVWDEMDKKIAALRNIEEIQHAKIVDMDKVIDLLRGVAKAAENRMKEWTRETYEALEDALKAARDEEAL